MVLVSYFGDPGVEFWFRGRLDVLFPNFPHCLLVEAPIIFHNTLPQYSTNSSSVINLSFDGI